jgi:hypothetical protein
MLSEGRQKVVLPRGLIDAAGVLRTPRRQAVRCVRDAAIEIQAARSRRRVRYRERAPRRYNRSNGGSFRNFAHLLLDSKTLANSSIVAMRPLACQ